MDAASSPILCVLSCFIAIFCHGSVHISMCNDGSYLPKYDSLTVTDLKRIQKLEQLQIVSRHGSRTGQHTVRDIFPNFDPSTPNTEWECNFTTITARSYGTESFMALQKNYIPGEEFIGGNCGDSQSTFEVIEQHRKNALLVRDYYIGAKPKHLFSRHEVDEVMDDIFIRRKFADNNSPIVKIISGDLERTYSTASVFMTFFLKYSDGVKEERKKSWIYNGNKDYLYSYTHDAKVDPYVPQHNARCTKLKAYIGDLGMQTSVFQDWIHSAQTKAFFKRWRKEVGYKFRANDKFFKLCENILWMYCSEINLIPHVISEQLFSMIHNFTIEWRVKLLNNGATSHETTSLASKPFAWILKTLISDHVYYLEGEADNINGYMDAEQAKFVFHSTRGISTLYFMSALGIGDGVEPPYANLVNFEVYSKNKQYTDELPQFVNTSNVFDRYLFRITKMGEFVPFPGCEQDYNSNKSTLCHLSVMIDRLSELAVPLNEWEEECNDVTTEYFKNNKIMDLTALDMTGMDVDEVVELLGVNQPSDMDSDQSFHSMDQASTKHAMGMWHFVIGTLFGAVVVWFMDRWRFFSNVFKDSYAVVE